MTFLDQKRPDMQTWTDERVERLKKLWADGLSASQIAGELGGVTRNAVIGKVHRLGLSGRRQPTPTTKRHPPAHPPRIPRPPHKQSGPPPPPPPPPAAPARPSRWATWRCRPTSKRWPSRCSSRAAT